jgi:hypothetical protein
VRGHRCTDTQINARQPKQPEPVVPELPGPVLYAGGPVEFERVVPASGNMRVAGKQFWLGPARSTVTFWADTDVIHLTIAGAPPLPPAEPGAAIEVDRTVARNGAVHLAGCYGPAGEILAGRRVSIRIEEATLMFLRSRDRPRPFLRQQAAHPK